MLDINLFASEIERDSFLTFKASQRQKDLKKDEDTYLKEIDDFILKSKTIFEKYESTNYISELYDVLGLLSNAILSEEEKEKYNAKRTELLNGFSDFLNQLMKKYADEMIDLTKKLEYLNDKEDLEFIFKSVFDRNQYVLSTREMMQSLETDFPNAKSFDYNIFRNLPTISAIIGYQKPISEEEFEVKTDDEIVEVDDSLTGKLVTGISEYVGMKQESLEEEKESIDVPVVTEDLISDNAFYGVDDNLKNLISGENLPTTVSEEEKITPLEYDLSVPETTDESIELVPDGDEPAVVLEREEVETPENEPINIETPVGEIKESNLEEVKPEESTMLNDVETKNEELVEDVKTEEESIQKEVLPEEPVEVTDVQESEELNEINKEEVVADNNNDKLEEENLEKQESNEQIVEAPSVPESNEENIATNEAAPQQEENSNYLDYQMDDGICLHDLASVIYSGDDAESKNKCDSLVEKIIATNKDLIDQRLKERNIDDLSNIEFDNTLFSGLTFVIPVEFEQEMSPSSKTL